LKVNVKNIQLNEEKNFHFNFYKSQKCSQDKVDYIQSTIIMNNNQIINKTSTIKGNLFRNTSRYIKHRSQATDTLEKFAGKDFNNFSITYNAKDYKNIINSENFKDLTQKNADPFNINIDENNINNNLNAISHINKNNLDLDILIPEQKIKNIKDINKSKNLFKNNNS
jgi:hypothetical protein